MTPFGLRLPLIAVAACCWVAATVGVGHARGPAAQGSSSQIQEVAFRSEALGKRVTYRVYLPANYSSLKKGGYPVIYALHGLGGHAKDWFEADLGDLNNTLDALIAAGTIEPVIVVAPNGGNAYWTNHLGSAEGPGPRHGDVIGDVITHAEARYAVRTRGRPRAIVGVSMGGHGAMSQALMRPEYFAAAVSLSGALFPVAPKHRGIYKRVWGDITDPEHWAKTSPIALITAATQTTARGWPALYILCGDDDRFGFTAQALNAYTLLHERKIPVELRIVDGGHSWAPWRQSAAEWLRFIDAHW